MKRIIPLALLAPSLALAQNTPKYRKAETQIEARQTDLTKPSTPVKEKKPAAPTITGGDVFRGKGGALHAITNKEIAKLQELIDGTPDDEVDDKGDLVKPDLLFRMADLYSDQQHYYDFRARELDEKIFAEQQRGNKAGAQQLQRQQKDYDTKAHQWLIEAAKKYIYVVDNPKFASYKKMDAILFEVARLLSEQKKEEAARKYFARLIKEYPTSQFIPDAYLAWAEYAFENKDIDKALERYEKVLKYPDSRVYGYAMYKEGWCYFNLQDFPKALKQFVQVIKEQSRSKESGKIQLVKEARKDSARALSQIMPTPTPDAAWNFFKNITNSDEKLAKPLMELLGEQYNSQGKFDDAVKTYHKLMELFSKDVKLCEWQTEVLKNTLSRTGSRATPDSVQELTRLSKIYEAYKTIPGAKKEQLDECKDNTSGMLRELATTWHKEAQKTKVMETYALAQNLYKEYIARFPHERDIYQMSFYYAELLFTLGDQDNSKFCEAAPVYTQVVKMNPADNAKYRNEAALAAVYSWKNCLNMDESREQVKEQQPAQQPVAKKGKKGKAEPVVAEAKKYDPLPIPEKQQKMLEAFDMYLKYVPNSPELPQILYNRARTLYEYNHFKDAIPYFRLLVDKHRDSDLAVYSANLMFDSENILGDFDQLESDTKTYCPWPELAKDGDFKKTCDGLLSGIARKKIERWQKDGKWRLAADEYIRLATEHPDDPRLLELYFNAHVSYENAHAIGKAIEACNTLIKKDEEHRSGNPTAKADPLAQKCVFMIGRAFRDIAAYDKAADNFETFASKFPGEKAPYDASQALFTASFFRRGLGETDKSIEDTNLFVKLYGGRKEYEDKAAGVVFGVGQIYEAQKDYAKLQKHLLDYLKQWGSKGGIDREIIANVKLGDLFWKASCPVGDGVNGACVQIERVRASSASAVSEKARKGKRKKKGLELSPQCGPDTKTKVTIFDRKPALAKQAQAYYAAALKEYAGGAALKKVPGADEKERSARSDSMMYFVAEARMKQGDEQYEKFLGIKFPDKLDFSPPNANDSPKKQKAAQKRLEEAKKKFTNYLETKKKMLDAATAIYQNVILFKQAHWAIAGAARIGQLYQDFSGQLYTAQVPKIPTPKELTGEAADEFQQTLHDNFCDALTDKAEPIEAQAVDALSTCLSTSTRLSWFNEWSQLCEGELNQLKPSEYPLASEIRAQPGYYDRKPDSGTLITEIK